MLERQCPTPTFSDSTSMSSDSLSDLLDDDCGLMSSFDDTCLPCTDGPQGAYDWSLCQGCQMSPKVFGQKVCMPCSTLVTGARRSAKKKDGGAVGDQTKFLRAVIKQGGPMLMEALQTYSNDCMLRGRGEVRPEWDWLQYGQRTSATSSVTTGNRVLWMTLSRFQKHRKDWFGEDKPTAEIKFKELLHGCVPGIVSPCKTMIAVMETPGGYIDTANTKAFSEELTNGHKVVRNPTPEDFALRNHWLGTDHDDFAQGSLLTKNLPRGLSDMLPSNPYSMSSGSLGKDVVDAKQRLEDEKNAAKLAKKESVKKRQAAKPFEVAPETQKMKMFVTSRFAELRDLINSTTLEASAILEKVNQTEHLKSGLSALTSILAMRKDMLVAFRGVDANEVAVNDELLQTFKDRTDVKEATEATDEPYSGLGKLVTFKRMEDECQVIRLTGWEQSRQRKADITVIVGEVQALRKHVKVMITRVTQGIQNIQASALRVEKKNQKKMAAEAEKSINIQRRAIATPQEAALKADEVQLWKHDMSKIQKVPEVVIGAGASFSFNSIHPSSKPLLVKQILVIDASVVTAATAMLQKFKNNKLWSESKRASELPVGALQTRMPAPVALLEASKLTSLLTENEVGYLSSKHIFAMANDGCSSGPESLALPSMKYQLQGTRKLLLVDFSSLLSFIQSAHGTGASFTLRQLCKLVENADGETWAALQRYVIMYYVVVGPLQTMFIPWGYLAFDMVCNNEPILGVKWSLLSDDPSASYLKMASVMLPDSVNIKPTSNQAMMAKLLLALSHTQNCDLEAVDAGIGKKMPALAYWSACHALGSNVAKRELAGPAEVSAAKRERIGA